MNRFVRSLAFVLALLQPAVAAATPPLPAGVLEAGGSAVATGVIDGDTLVLDDGSEVRLVGIQAPKLPLGREHVAKWRLADEAKAALAELTLGRRLALHYGGARRDRYGRHLAHLALPDDGWVQGALLAAGLARVYSFADNRALVAEILALEDAARRAGRGIWALQWYAVRGPEELVPLIGTFQVVEGRIVDAAEVRGRRFLNFGADWRTDFTVTVSARDWKRFAEAGLTLDNYAGRRVRVRGWLDSHNGPSIGATHPDQIELLETPARAISHPIGSSDRR